VIRRAFVVALLAVGVVPVAGAAGPCASAAAAPGMHRAGLVVEFPDASTRSYCVAFGEDSITGLELLQRTGLSITFQDYGGGNVTVCSIDGKGCDYPRVPCFCKCANTNDCTFWGYYSIAAPSGAWRFQSSGSSARTVHDGDVDGWRWGRHGTAGTAPPPDATLAKICATGIHVDAAAAKTPSRTRSRTGAAVFVAFLAAALVAGASAGLRSRRNKDET